MEKPLLRSLIVPWLIDGFVSNTEIVYDGSDSPVHRRLIGDSGLFVDIPPKRGYILLSRLVDGRASASVSIELGDQQEVSRVDAWGHTTNPAIRFHAAYLPEAGIFQIADAHLQIDLEDSEGIRYKSCQLTLDRNNLNYLNDAGLPHRIDIVRTIRQLLDPSVDPAELASSPLVPYDRDTYGRLILSQLA